MHLFQTGCFRLASGENSTFKIECDALSDDDWWTLSVMIARAVHPIREVRGVPRGGLKLAQCLQAQVNPDGLGCRLLVDDVWTTGGSMLKMLEPNERGCVVFARNKIVHPRVRALFTMNPMVC